MQDISPFLRHRLLAPWVIVLLIISVGALLAPIHSGRSWLNPGTTTPKAAGIVPGVTLEVARGRLVVTSVRTHSQAAKQGVSVGDAVVAIDGRSMLTLEQAQRYLRQDRASTIRIRLVHGQTAREVPLELKEA